MVRRDNNNTTIIFNCITLLLILPFLQFCTAIITSDFDKYPNLQAWRNVYTNTFFANQTASLTPYQLQDAWTYWYDDIDSPGASWSPSYGLPLSVGFSISGFIAFNNSEWSPQIKLKTLTSTSITYIVSVLGNTHMTFFGINYLIVRPTDPYIRLYSQCFNTQSLYFGSGYRIQYRNKTTDLNKKNLKVAIFLYGFELFHHNSKNSFLKATAMIKNYSSIIQYSFSTAQNNTVKSICYTTVVFDYLGTQTAYTYFGQINQYSLSNTVDPTSIIVSPAYTFTNRMFFGINSFNLSNLNLELKFKFYSSIYYNSLATNYATNNGTYDVTLSAFFAAYRSCPTNSYYFNPSLMQCQLPCTAIYNLTTNQLCISACHYTCLNCNGPTNQNCTSCDPTRDQTLTNNKCPCLNNSYIDIGEAACMECKAYLDGCLTCTSKTVCSSCQTGFSLSGSKCVCILGKSVSGICTTMVGCENMLIVGLSQKCIQCNQSLGYVLFNWQCICLNGYSSDGIHCQSLCGNGIVQYDEQCDDNNLVNGDGCSSNCKVEDSWQCESSPSSCKLNVDPKLTLRYVSRVVSSNTMLVSFSMNPYHPRFSEVNFNEYISHNVPANSFRAVYTHPGLLNIEFDYYQSIQGNKYQLTLNFPDSLLLYATQSKLSIPATGMNAKLTYDKYYEHTFPLQIVIYIVDALAIVVFIIGVFIEKFIVVEMIQTIQLPLFMLVLLSNCPSTYQPIQKLRYSNGFNYVTEEDKTRTYSYSYRVSSIGIEKEFLLNFNVMFGILLLALVVSIVAKLMSCFIRRKKALQPTQQPTVNFSKIADKIFQISFSRVFIGVGLLSMYQVIFSMIIMINSDIQAKQNLVSIDLNVVFSILAGFIIIGIILLVMINYFTGRYNMLYFFFASPCYPTFYISINLLIILFISILFLQSWTIFVISAIIVLNLVSLIILRPYTSIFQNVCIIFNQFVLIFVGILYLIGQYTSGNQTDQWELVYLICLYVLVFFFFTIILTTIFRLWHWIYYQDYIISKQGEGAVKQQKQPQKQPVRQKDFIQFINHKKLLNADRQDRVHLKNVKNTKNDEQSVISVDSVQQVKQRLRQDLLRKAQTMEQ